jgi:hypothetical protein
MTTLYFIKVITMPAHILEADLVTKATTALSLFSDFYNTLQSAREEHSWLCARTHTHMILMALHVGLDDALVPPDIIK